MKRLKLIVMLLFILVLYLNLEYMQGAFDKGIMNVQLLSMEEIEALCEGKEETFLEPHITLSGAKIAYDNDNNMLLIPQALEIENFQGRLSVPEGNLYFLEEEVFTDKAGAIGSNQVFRLFWITETQCWMYNVYFTGMPVLCLTTEMEENEESIGSMWLYDQYRAGGGISDVECTWHIRGNTTRNYDKSSYKLTLTVEKIPLLGMRQDDDWILHALYDDYGMIHNKVSYEVWQRIAASNHVAHDEGISMEYVELVKDGEYRGVYGISEQIDRKELDLNSKDILYKWKLPGYPEKDDFYNELTDDMEPHFVMKYPAEHAEQEWEPLRQWISLFLTEDMTDYDAGKMLLNMENAIDYNLFLLLSAANDNIQKNVFLWADYQKDGSYSFIKVPWDLNMTWGNSYCDEYACHFNKYQRMNLESTWSWAPDVYRLYLYDSNEIGRLMRERWQELRNDIITKESLTEIVNEQYQYLYSSGAYARNAWLWAEEGDYWSDEYIYEYIDKRIDFLDDYIGQMGQ